MQQHHSKPRGGGATSNQHSLNTSFGSINLLLSTALLSPASIDPDQRSTIFSITTSNISPSRNARLLITIASLNSPNARGRDAVSPLLETRAFLPCTWWNLRSLQQEHQYKYYRNLHKVLQGFTSTLSQPKYSQQSEWLWDWFPARAPSFSSLSLYPEVILRLSNVLSNG